MHETKEKLLCVLDTMNKMSRGDNVTVEMLGRICEALNCGVDDIMEFVPDSKTKK